MVLISLLELISSLWKAIRSILIRSSLRYGQLLIIVIGKMCFNRLRCKNVAAILELDEKLTTNYKRFTAAPDDFRDPPLKKPIPEYFL
jgi:hypothetical protein